VTRRPTPIQTTPGHDDGSAPERKVKERLRKELQEYAIAALYAPAPEAPDPARRVTQDAKSPSGIAVFRCADRVRERK
jgi:hypothetical protein